MPTDLWGDPRLLELLANLFNSFFYPKLRVRSSHIGIASGAAASLDTLLWNVCNEGDGVLIPGPYWSMHAVFVAKSLLTVVDGYDVHCANRSAVTPILVTFQRLLDPFSNSIVPALEQAYATSDRPVKALILTNPHNPLGQCYLQRVLEECLRFCQRRDLQLISEEVYALSTFHPSQSDLPETRQFVSASAIDPIALGCDPARIQVIWSMSKDLASAGIKLVTASYMYKLRTFSQAIAELYSITVEPSGSKRSCHGGVHERLNSIDSLCSSSSIVSIYANANKSEFSPLITFLPPTNKVL